MKIIIEITESGNLIESHVTCEDTYSLRPLGDAQRLAIALRIKIDDDIDKIIRLMGRDTQGRSVGELADQFHKDFLRRKQERESNPTPPTQSCGGTP